MENLLLAIFCVLCACIFLWEIKRPERTIEYPFFSVLVFSGWVLPQFFKLHYYNYLLPRNGLSKALFMTILCLVCLFVGYRVRKKPLQSFYWKFSRKRLVKVAAGLSLIGFVFFVKVSAMAEEATRLYGGQWTGPITIYYFFSGLLFFGFVIALLVFLKKPSPFLGCIIALDISVYLYRILMLGRRAAMAELFALFLLASWYQRKWIPSRSLVVVLALGGVLIVNSIGDYRSIVVFKDNITWKSVINIDFFQNLTALNEESALEVKNSIFVIDTVDKTNMFNFGLSYWDAFVSLYFPAQIFGSHVKNMLFLTRSQDQLLYDYSSRYVRHIGSTTTGMSDAFYAFWFFGGLVFFLIAYILDKLHRSAVNGHFIAQFLVIVLMTPALHAITHSTSLFFLHSFLIAVFLAPCFCYAKCGEMNSSHSKRL